MLSLVRHRQVSDVAYIYENVAISGRLNYVFNQALAKDFRGDQVGQIYLFNVPPNQDLQAELGFLTTHVPSYVCAMGGEYYDGSQWMVLLCRGPGTDGFFEKSDAAYERGIAGMDRGLDIALSLNPHLTVFAPVEINPLWLSLHYATHGYSGASILSFTDQLRGLVAEACGYPISLMAKTFAEGCAFGAADHDCQGEFFADVFRGWLDKRVQPGTA